MRRPVANTSGLFDVSDDHRLWVVDVGTGVPVVFLHGGPGSGCRTRHQSLFDPVRHRAILFDQRGAGRSLPSRSLRANTTQHLIADIEAIRVDRGFDRWLVVGGSWGATLALAYAETHPERVAGIVLRAVFLGTRAELDWAFVESSRRIRPELFRDFLSLLPEAERDDPLPAYWRRILDPDPAIHRSAIWAWHDAERILSEADPPKTRVDIAAQPQAPLPATPLFEAHYLSHNCFLTPNQLIENADRLAQIPGIIIQGRYDLLCPPSTSAALADAWPAAEIRYVEGVGHAMSEPGVESAMRHAIAELAHRTFS